MYVDYIFLFYEYGHANVEKKLSEFKKYIFHKKRLKNYIIKL